MFGGVRRVCVLMLFVVALLAPLPSHAFCGFFVNTSDQPLFNDATRVVMMRVGLRTVLSIQNDYQGPLEDFALVVPVPIVLERENVRTLPPSIFAHVDGLTSPRLVEYWEQDPCDGSFDTDNKEGGTGTRAKGGEGSLGNPSAKPLVVVERQFSVDEYDVVVLSARDSGALEAWLHENKYVIPRGAEPYLRPYVQEGSKFFVAKVDIKRVRFRWNRAQLSPLRFHYDTPEFKLPIRLGLINSHGEQDLIVNILGPKRYETANYENVFIPTNIGLKDETRNQFNSFYAALFDRTVASHPRAVVTEYAWSPQSCDPCPAGAGPLADEDTKAFGSDVIQDVPKEFVLTRLHARYGKETLGDDLVFREAEAVVGGREERDASGLLLQGAKRDSTNAFQARYIIRHPWEGKITCASPRGGQWGGPPDGRTLPPPRPNPHANRDLKIDELMLDPSAERTAHAGTGGGPKLFSLLAHLVRPQDWSREEAALGGLATYVLGLAGATIWSRRRRTGALKTLGRSVGFAALSILVGYVAESRTFGDSRALGEFTRQSVVGLGISLMLIGFAAGRTSLVALWALFPAAAGLVAAVQNTVAMRALIKTDFVNLELDQLGRIFSEITAETLEPVVLGAAVAGSFGVVAVGLAQLRHRGEKWKSAAIALGIGVGLRALFIGDRLPIDVLTAVALALALLVIARSDRFDDMLVAVTGVLLVDIAGQLLITRTGFASISSDALDPRQVERIVEYTMKQEHRRLLFTLLDAALLGAVALAHKARVRNGSLDWRTCVIAAAAVLGCATSFEWLGQRTLHRSLDVRAARSEVFPGPALFVENGALLASPWPSAPPQPYTPRVALEMARAESGTRPLLVGRADQSIGSLMDTLASLLRTGQTDFRLIGDRPPPAELGIYGPFVATRSVGMSPVELRPTLSVVHKIPAEYADGIKMGLDPDKTAVFGWDGKTFAFREVELQGMDLIPLKWRQVEPFSPRRIKSIDEATLVQSIVRRKATFLVVPPATTLATIDQLLFQLNSIEAGAIILSTDQAAFEQL